MFTLLSAILAVVTVTKCSAFKMDAACRITRDLVANNPVKPDVSNDYEAVQAWPLATALYNGIEQALKMLLLVPSSTCFTLDNLARRYSHDLEALYAELAIDDRAHIELHFREHWSLYDYDTRGSTIDTAEQFIAHVNSGDRQRGLISWRYILIEDAKIPPTSLWTMSEIWDAVCCRIREEVFDKPDDCFRLSRRLFFDFNNLVLTRPVPYDNFLDDINRWTNHKDRSHLAAWIDLLVKANRNAIHEVQALEQLRQELAILAGQAMKQTSGMSAHPDHAQLLRRVQQAESGLAWDPGHAMFRGVPPD